MTPEVLSYSAVLLLAGLIVSKLINLIARDAANAIWGALIWLFLAVAGVVYWLIIGWWWRRWVRPMIFG